MTPEGLGVAFIVTLWVLAMAARVSSCSAVRLRGKSVPAWPRQVTRIHGGHGEP